MTEPPAARLLDDLGALATGDPARMLDAVLGLPAQCQAGHAAGRGAEGLPLGGSLASIVLCGMGGSGVSGDIVRALYRDRLAVPVDVVRDPVLPEYCGKDTLVLCSSYSGNTAETLAAFDEATRRGCRAVSVTCGGELGRRSRELGVPVVPVAPGYQPRAALGLLLFGALGALEAVGMVPPLEDEVEETVAVLEGLGRELGPDRGLEANEAKAVAVWIGERFPVIWGAEGLGAVAATRWKTQMNENAEVPAFSSSLPELDHNEVVGWSDGAGERFAVVALRHEGEHPDVGSRFAVSESFAASSGAVVREVWAIGESALARVMSLAMKGDLASVYLALLRGVDPTPVAAIDRVKSELAVE